MWFTETTGSGSYVGEVDPGTDAISTFATPTVNAFNAGAGSIVAGPDGNLWFTEFAQSGEVQIGDINPVTHAISEFSVGLSLEPIRL